MNIFQRSALSGLTGVKQFLYRASLTTPSPWSVLLRIFLGKHPVRRVLLVGGAVTMAFFLFTMVQQVSAPLQTGAAVAGYTFGKGDDSGQFPQPCDAPPPPGGRPSIITRTGVAGPDAVKSLKNIPQGADMAAAQGYLLYTWAHPDSKFPKDWQEWIDSFYATSSTQTRAKGTGLNVVQTMDPDADYSPYLRLSRAAVYQMVMDGKITGDPDRLRDEMDDLLTDCVK